MAKGTDSEADARAAYHHAWYLAHADDQRARARDRYQRNRDAVLDTRRSHYAEHRQELVENRRAYRGTAAGMLTQVRQVAKKRGR